MSTPARTASLTRTTSESSVELEINLDGTGVGEVNTGVRFYDHMLLSLAKHSLIDLRVKATGDSTSTPTTPSRTSPSSSATHCARPSATSGSRGSATPRCRSTRPWSTSSSTWPVAPTSCTPASPRGRSTSSSAATTSAP